MAEISGLIESRPRVLLVEDSPADAQLLRHTLRTASSPGFSLKHVEYLTEAAKILEAEQFEVVVVDLSLPDSQGLETVKRICAVAPHTAIVVMTGLDDETLALEALHFGAQDYLVKGQCTGPMIARTLHYALERKRSLEERERLIRELEDALATVKKLSGLLPICAVCKRIRDENDEWWQMERYIDDHSEASFTHGLCAECTRTLYPEL